MSEINPVENMDEMQAPGMTDEEIAALEAQRQAAYEAELAPYKALRERMDNNASELTDLQLALVDVYEQILTP